MALIPRFYKDSVVAIGCRKNNEISWMATGFLVAKDNGDNTYNAFLVSNAHVFVGPYKEIVVRFNKDGSIAAQDFDFELYDDNNQPLFTVHPNPKVDVACMKIINPNEMTAAIGKWNIFILDNTTLTRDEMLSNDIVEGTLVYSLGFPSRLVGNNTKSPLCRLGCISRISEMIDDYGYFIDIQNFPGSSGSPIINRLESIQLKGSSGFNETRLIGILAKYKPYRDSLISAQTGEVMQVTQENSGIAIAYTVDAIKDVIAIEDKIRT